MATVLYLRDTQTNGIGSGTYDLNTEAGSATTTNVVGTTSGGTEIQWTDTNGGSVVEWISGRSPTGGWTLSGTVTFSIWAQESNMNANIGARARLFKRTSGGTVTEIGGGPWNDGVEFSTSATEMVWTGTPTSTSFAEDDRLIVRYYITNVGTMGSGFTGTLTFNGADGATGDSFVQINENITFKPDSVDDSDTPTTVSSTGEATAASVSIGADATGVEGGGAASAPTASISGFPTTASGAGTLGAPSLTLISNDDDTPNGVLSVGVAVPPGPAISITPLGSGAFP